MTEFVLIRHGETDWNRELRFQGQIDVPLNEIGLLQAERLGQRIQGSLTEWVQQDRVPVHLVSSDLVRARQTAAPVAHALGVDCALEPGLREQSFGLFEGLQVAQIREAHADHWEQWTRFDADHALPRAESTRHFHARVMACLHRLAQRYPGERVVVVTHGGVLDMVWRDAQGASLHGPRVCDIPNAGVNHVQRRDTQLHILHWADTTHLGDLPPQPVYRQTQRG